MTFDCRGIEPTAFDPRDGFVVKAVDNGQLFEDVTFDNLDWSDYCEKNSNPVSISEFNSQFIKLKGK